MTKIIEILVSPQGETSIQTKGFAGSECRQASQDIERALGQRTDEQLTAEFHQRALAQQSNQQTNQQGN